MSLRLKLSVLLTALFITAIGNALFTFVLEDQSEEKLKLVIHTYEVIDESDSLLMALQNAETGQRGYLLTGNPNYLEPYHTGLLVADKHLSRLLEMTQGNPTQQERLVNVGELMSQKFLELKETINLKKDSLTSAQAGRDMMAIINQDTGKIFMDGIRKALDDFHHEEHLLLEVRKGDFREVKAYITTFVFILIVFFVFLGLLTVSFVKVNIFDPLATLLASTHKMEDGGKPLISDILPNDEMGYLLSSFYKMSEKVYENAASLTYKANHDELTGLRNRASTQKEITESINELNTLDTKMAILFIDLDKFKQLNDTYGHDAGDFILKETAERLKECVRSDDVVFRLGGDEFLVVLKNITEHSHAKSIVTKITKRFNQPALFNGKNIDIPLSIGIAISPDDSTDSEEIVKFSDVAMYAAKNDANSNFEFFDRTMLKRANDH